MHTLSHVHGARMVHAYGRRYRENLVPPAGVEFALTYNPNVEDQDDEGQHEDGGGRGGGADAPLLLEENAEEAAAAGGGGEAAAGDDDDDDPFAQLSLEDNVEGGDGLLGFHALLEESAEEAASKRHPMHVCTLYIPHVHGVCMACVWHVQENAEEGAARGSDVSDDSSSDSFECAADCVPDYTLVIP